MDDDSEEWLRSAAAHLGVEPLQQAEITALLDAARDVAHNGERRHAPLTCFLLGLAAARDRAHVVGTAAEIAALARASGEST